MSRIFLLLFLISSATFAQDLKLIKATKQTTNAGASPTSTINYTIQVKKTKKCKLLIDSVVNVYTEKANPFNVYTIVNSHSILVNPIQSKSVTINGKGAFSINFHSMKSRGNGRPGAPPMELMVPIADYTQGAIIYYRVGKKKKKLTIDSFEELETINAP